ncbi:MAG TPA: hypothetical protein VLG71_02965, partial [Candidatus Limnocylindria bacterium]|nr:hypothetical protein [Candidatus Limnocylindria bacterium]
MKIIIRFFMFVCLALLPLVAQSAPCDDTCDTRFATLFTAGYVFKHDCFFNKVYGPGMINVITGDFCYYPWQAWGLGVKASYWRKHGRTLFLRQCSLLQEVPVTVYARAKKEFDCGLQLYGSLGAGVAWIKEKSYLGSTKVHKGLGEVEIGLIR